jgi:hypothetical protein
MGFFAIAVLLALGTSLSYIGSLFLREVVKYKTGLVVAFLWLVWLCASWSIALVIAFWISPGILGN